MADEVALKEALVRAHQAGDTEAANLLADEIRGMQVKSAQGPTLRQKVMASTPMRIVQGARDAVDAGAQLLPRGLEQVTSGFGVFPNTLSNWFGSEAMRVDKMVQGANKEYEDARTATGQTGTDVARIVGNVVSPANLAIAARVPIAAGATVPTMIGKGAVGGAAGGLLTPVTDPSADFGMTKVAQTGLGAVTGGLLTPVVGKAVEAGGRYLANKTTPARVVEQRAEAAAQEAPQMVSRELGPMASSVPAADMSLVQQKVQEALAKGQKIDPAAALRQIEFEKANMPAPLLGQITRDPAQYARERNLRGVEGAGEPIMMRLTAQNQALQEKIGGFGGANAGETLQAGTAAIDRLRAVDQQLKSAVDTAYNSARNSAGRDAVVPTDKASEAFARVLYDYGRENVPSAVASRFREFGMAPSQGMPAADAVTRAETVAAIRPRLPQISQALDAEQQAAAAVQQARDSYVSALRDVGKFQTMGARAETLSNQWAPIPGLPRLPGQYAPTKELVGQAEGAAQDAMSIMRDRQAALRAAETAYREAQTQAKSATRGVPADIMDNLRSGQPALPEAKPFTINDAERILQLTNEHGNSPLNRQQSGAMTVLNKAVKEAILQMDDAGGVFAPARELAAKRFATHDAIPALADAVAGKITPDKFVQQQVLAAPAKDVRNLAKVLDPESLGKVREQIGAHLQRAAFGENTAGDKLFAPERFNKALRDIGTEKLRAFYSADEIEQLFRLGRVGAYINSHPAAAAVNTSNTAGQLMNLARLIPGAPALVNVANSGLQALGRQRLVDRALAAQVPVQAADLSPGAQAAISGLLSLPGPVSGGLLASELR